MLDRVMPLERHSFRVNGSTFVTEGLIPTRHPEGADFYDVNYFAGGRRDRGVQFPSDHSYLDPHSAYEGKFIDMLAWITEQVPQGDILDVGTGPGHLAYQAMQSGSPLTIYGCDISRELLRSEHNLNPTRTVEAKIYDLPFASGSFKGVLFSDVLEHVHPEQTMQAVQEGMRVLEPGGSIFIRIPNRETWTDAALHDEAHVWLPNPQEVRDLLELAGFEPDSIDVFTRGFPETQEYIAQNGTDLLRPEGGTAICALAKKSV